MLETGSAALNVDKAGKCGKLEKVSPWKAFVVEPDRDFRV